MKSSTPKSSRLFPLSETATPLSAPLSSSSSRRHRPPRVPKENLDPNLRSRNPLKRKLYPDAENDATAPDSGVQVVVRVRPVQREEEDGEMIIEKISGNLMGIQDHVFTFDSVADANATQEDIFRLVGLPLVENCLAGFNSSIFAYGQTGSGKTYTMWGPMCALSEESLSSTEMGLTPRVFGQLFARINEEQVKHSDRHLSYQCRCSFLEIYNEQITDLLDPSQRNLQIREDVRTGVYVDYLKEEEVHTMKDVIELLMKGLANRRTGSTSINMESSRSHCVFTCVVESRSKSVDGLVSLRTSRINLVDLAGSERQKQTGAAGERLKEAGNINRSLSQLGNLINILAEVSQSGKQRHIPYRDSRLTFLLQESLGGNSKLAMICAISPSRSCKSETFSTLRFAQRAKAIKNNAVINETTQDDVNLLRELIRQLEDEIMRMKSNAPSANNENYSTGGWNARRSLTLLKMSLSPTGLSAIKDDSDEEMEIDENETERPLTVGQVECYLANGGEEEKNRQVMSEYQSPNSSKSSRSNLSPSNLTVVPCKTSPGESPTLSMSPVGETFSRKILRTSKSASASSKSMEKIKSHSKALGRSSPQASYPPNASSSPAGKNAFASTERIAASLQCGLQIINSLRHSSILRRSSFGFHTKPTDIKTCAPVNMVNVGIQTLDHEFENLEAEYICSLCSKVNILNEIKVANNGSDMQSDNGSSDMQLVCVDDPVHVSGSTLSKKFKIQVPKAVEKVLTGSIRREMALEEHCGRQAVEIMQLNRLVHQYKHERECNAIIARTREEKISRLESLMDGILTTEEFMDEEFTSLVHEHKILQDKYDNNPETLRLTIELRRIQKELESYKNYVDLGERDVLLEEIQDLRNQLQYYLGSSSRLAKNSSALLRLTHSPEISPAPLSTIPEIAESNPDEKVESESCNCTEKESKWISLTEELRLELEASRTNGEKLKVELDSEKKCLEELKEALQSAMQGHARILEQYADLQEKHIAMLARQRQISDGTEDVKKAAAKAGVKGAESKFINSLAAQISVLRVEREKERRYWKDENKGLQAQLRDTAEALQAAGELLVRLKEAEEAAATAQKRLLLAEQETEKAYQEIDNLKKNYDKQIVLLSQLIEESSLHKDPAREVEFKDSEAEKYGGDLNAKWTDELGPSMDTDPSSWYSDYDRCNI